MLFTSLEYLVLGIVRIMTDLDFISKETNSKKNIKLGVTKLLHKLIQIINMMLGKPHYMYLNFLLSKNEDHSPLNPDL